MRNLFSFIYATFFNYNNNNNNKKKMMKIGEASKQIKKQFKINLMILRK